MKRLTTKISLICLTVSMVFLLTNCQDRISPAPPISTDSYPTISVVNPQAKTVSEGDTIYYKFTADKPVQHLTPFTAYDIKGAVPGSDMLITQANYPNFLADTSATMQIIFPNDNIPEKESQKITYKVGIDPVNNVGLVKSINPNSEVPEDQSITVKNHNNPNGLTVAYQWKEPKDGFKMLVAFQNSSGLGLAYLSSDSNPLIVVNSNADPDGLWLYAIAADTTNKVDSLGYTFKVGYPDQSVKYFKGSLNFKKADSPNSKFPILVYQKADYIVLFTINKSGGNYTNANNLSPNGANIVSPSIKLKGVSELKGTPIEVFDN